MATIQGDGRRRVVIEGITPEVDAGRFPVKRTVGELVEVEADVFTDGHDSISASVLVHQAGGTKWTEVPMKPIGNDRWAASFRVHQIGRYGFKVQGWVDHFETWRRDLLKRIDAGTDAPVDYLIGADLLDSAGKRARGADSKLLRDRAKELRLVSAVGKKARSTVELRATATDATLHQAAHRYPNKQFATESDREVSVVVDPAYAQFSAWYEFFPRSTASEAGRHGTFADCEQHLPYVKEMGFDVVYMPPIHPIGRQFRKGRNNNPESNEGDYGSPWAIGSADGGHKGILPELGTLEDFRSLVKKAGEMGLLLALDIAFQSAPDHPYVKEHESWFKKRPDGTIQYAENPPKKYQDIYPFDFESDDWKGMWEELKSVFLYWIKQGVTVFRVDNPHTKAFPFWEWCITEVKREHPEALFFAEAFTRPKVMYRLAKLGFSQSYTYFPWRTGKEEITAYLTELTQTPVREFFRANQWPNTPDILTEFLQIGGRLPFQIRLLLAATLGANYGIYGPAFELMESRPIRQGSEEYLDSEKYEVRHWDLNREDSLKPLITRVNAIRHENKALQSDRSLRFHTTDNERILSYSKESEDKSNFLLMVISLNPYNAESGFITLPLWELGIPEDRGYEVEDLLTGDRYTWTGPRNFVHLGTERLPGHIFKVYRDLPATPGEVISV